jgi:tetratricopeptide (TPR) repeat protein
MDIDQACTSKKKSHFILERIKSSISTQDLGTDFDFFNIDEWEYKFSEFLEGFRKRNNVSSFIVNGDFETAKSILKKEIDLGYSQAKQKLGQVADDSFQLATIYELEYNLSEAAGGYLNATTWANDNPLYFQRYGLCLILMGKYEEAQLALTRAQALSIGNIEISTKLLADFGKLYVRQGKDQMAKAYLKKFISVSKGTISFELAESYHFLGISYRNVASFRQSISNHKKSIQLFMELKMDSKAIENYTQIGSAYSQMGNSRLEAKSYLEAEKYINESNKNSLEVSELLNNIATMHYFKKDYIKAEIYFSRSLEILLKYFDENHSSCGERYHNLAATNLKINNLTTARHFAGMAIKIGEKTFLVEDNNPKLALRYNVLALILRAEGNLLSSLEYSKKAVEILTSKFSEIPAFYQIILDNHTSTLGIVMGNDNRK